MSIIIENNNPEYLVIKDFSLIYKEGVISFIEGEFISLHFIEYGVLRIGDSKTALYVDNNNPALQDKILKSINKFSYKENSEELLESAIIIDEIKEVEDDSSTITHKLNITEININEEI